MKRPIECDTLPSDPLAPHPMPDHPDIPKLKQLYRDGHNIMAALREQMRDVTMTQLQAVLRPEQITKFEVLREMARERGRGGRGRRGEGPAEE